MASWHPGEDSRPASLSSILLILAVLLLYVYLMGPLAVTLLGAAA